MDAQIVLHSTALLQQGVKSKEPLIRRAFTPSRLSLFYPSTGTLRTLRTLTLIVGGTMETLTWLATRAGRLIVADHLTRALPV
jgi:hypothetical protein